MHIYLAGGMKSNWRDYFTTSSKHVWYDPKEHGLEDPVAFTAWDLEHIRKADMIVVYLEESNSKPFGLMLEAGYAKALEKRVIVVSEHLYKTDDRRFLMLYAIADELYSSLLEFDTIWNIGN